MTKIMIFFCIFKIGAICSQQITTSAIFADNQTYLGLNVSNTHTYSPENDPGDDTFFVSNDNPVPEVVLDSESGVNIPQDPKIKNKLHYIPIPEDLLDKFSPVNLVKPIQEKLTKIREFLTYSNHPNYGGVQFLSPQQIWERLHEKGHQFLTGINGAVFGLANLDNHDYPFAYRQLKPSQRSKRSAIKEILTNYKEARPFMFKYDVNHEKIGKDNKSYKFPHLNVKTIQ